MEVGIGGLKHAPFHEFRTRINGKTRRSFSYSHDRAFLVTMIDTVKKGTRQQSDAITCGSHGPVTIIQSPEARTTKASSKHVPDPTSQDHLRLQRK